MRDIPTYGSFKKITPISKGMSGDKKYRIETDNGAHLLLRTADISELEQKRAEYDIAVKMSQNGVSMPRPVDFGVCGGGKSVYTLLEWIDGSEAEEVLPTLPKAEQYRLGVRSGEILAKIHTLDLHKHDESWYDRYFAVIDERLEAFRADGTHFYGDTEALGFLDGGRELLRGRPQCCHHGDYHMGNMVLSPDGTLYVIDWHTVDFDNYGDPWYEFNRVGVEHPEFASGQLDGYFGGNIPNDFWQLLKYTLQ